MIYVNNSETSSKIRSRVVNNLQIIFKVMTYVNNSETSSKIRSRIVNNLQTIFKVIIHVNNIETTSKIILSPQLKATKVNFHKAIQVRD